MIHNLILNGTLLDLINAEILKLNHFSCDWFLARSKVVKLDKLFPSWFRN